VKEQIISELKHIVRGLGFRQIYF